MATRQYSQDRHQTEEDLPAYSLSSGDTADGLIQTQDVAEPSANSHPGAPPPYRYNQTYPNVWFPPDAPRDINYTWPKASGESHDALRARQWTDSYPLEEPRELESWERSGLAVGYANFMSARDMPALLIPQALGWNLHSQPNCGNTCSLTRVPLYSAVVEATRPIEVKRDTTVAYFEVEIESISRGGGFAFGFVAMPYPNWRLPGWERASVGINSVDGRLYVCSSQESKSFTEPFKAGETIGIGMEFGDVLHPNSSASMLPSHNSLHRAPKRHTKLFLTRNAERREEWQWHPNQDDYDAKELDQKRSCRVEGLCGERDLHAAIGFFGEIKLNIKIAPHSWLKMNRR